MSPPLNRFHIPGGSLDLDFDEDHEGARVSVTLSLPVPPIQPIIHLSPEDLSSVLCRVSHPLASRTAEYVQALNLSGNAFRNLDLAALNVLANHDPAMADQLMRIQAGVLPGSLLLEASTQERNGSENNEPFSLNCNPPLPTPSPPPSTSIAPETPASSSWKEPASDSTIKNHSAGHDAAANPDVASDADDKPTDLIAFEGDAVAAPSTAGDRPCNSDLGLCTTAVLSYEETTADPPAQRSEREASSCGSGFHFILSDHDLSGPNRLAVQTTSAQQTSGEGDSQVDASGNSVHIAETETAVASVLASDDISKSSQGRGSSDGPTSASEAVIAVDAELMEADRGASPTDGGFSKSDIPSFGTSGAISRVEGPPDPGDSSVLTSPTHVSLDKNASRNSADVTSDHNKRAFIPNIVIPVLLSRDIFTPASGSSGSVLETPPATTTSDPVDESLELDLLDFSPFCFSAQFGHDAQMPLTELFKGSAYSISTSGTDLTCEERSGSRIDCTSNKSCGTPFYPTQIVLAHTTSPTPLSLAAESQNATSFLRDEDTIDISHRYENSEHENEDEGPAFHMEAVAADGDGHTDGHTHVDAHHVEGQAEKAIDSLRDIEEGSGTCDVKDLPGQNSSSSSACPASHVDGALGPASKTGPQNSLPSPRSETQFPTGAAESEDLRAESIVENSPSTKSVRSSQLRAQLRPPRLGLAIPISGISLQEELFQLSPLFSPSSETSECSKFGRLFSDSSVPRTQERLPIKLKRSSHPPRGPRVARRSRGTDTSDLTSPPTERILIDASIQTDEDREVENLRRRVKALERDLRSFRATIRRSEERVHESKPKSFWKKVASTDRVVPSPEPVNFSLLKLRNRSSSGSGATTSY
ncbi:hypothetical protein C8R45DRAFT_993575 [Mycena sanguinolenta]|nr:hypothetical protein C8R45DRAFT_993575 [Mycena sanguinolenta]